MQLHPDKTRLIEFGRFAANGRAKRGQGKPETFDFLGFTHICSKTRSGKFTILRKTIRRRWRAKLKEIYTELSQRMHEPVSKQGAYLRSVLIGHMRYYAVPMNNRSISAFRHSIQWLWWKTLKRRSQKHNMTWQRMRRLVDKWLPPVRIYHPYPLVRFGVLPEAGAG